MATVQSIRTNNQQDKAAEELVRRGEAENLSEAYKILINEGMREYGFSCGEIQETALKRTTERIAHAAALAGVIWLATTLYLPVGLRTPAIAAFAASAGLFGFSQLLDRWEPAVTERLGAIVGTGGDQA